MSGRVFLGALVDEERLSDVFCEDAADAGYGRAWVSYAAGRLGVHEAVVEVLATEVLPRDEPSALALADRYGVDGWLLWRVVTDGRRVE